MMRLSLHGKIATVKAEGKWKVITLNDNRKLIVADSHYNFKVGDFVVLEVFEGNACYFLDFVKGPKGSR